jgi:hypothetical protein
MSSMAGPIADVVLLLRGLVADRPLTPGTVLAARVVDREGARGTLLLNGVRVPAQLPSNLAVGDALRVRVQEATGERVVLQVVPPGTPAEAVAAGAAGQTTAGAYALLLPGGAHARLFVDGDGGSAAGPDGAPPPRTVTLRFDSPALGRLDFVLDLDPGAVSATVHATAGDPAERARAASGELRAALRDAADRPAAVHVRAREETLDVRA